MHNNNQNRVMTASDVACGLALLGVVVTGISLLISESIYESQETSKAKVQAGALAAFEYAILPYAAFSATVVGGMLLNSYCSKPPVTAASTVTSSAVIMPAKELKTPLLDKDIESQLTH